MEEQKFYICKHCGNLVASIKDAGVKMMCCGEAMTKLEPGTVEASHEKHIPVVTCKDGVVNVEVGSETHPMIESHYIEWIFLKTENGGQRRVLKPSDEPKAEFLIGNDKPVAVYAYCNLHGLWKTEI